jgi:hypothetical protein
MPLLLTIGRHNHHREAIEANLSLPQCRVQPVPLLPFFAHHNYGKGISVFVSGEITNALVWFSWKTGEMVASDSFSVTLSVLLSWRSALRTPSLPYGSRERRLIAGGWFGHG